MTLVQMRLSWPSLGVAVTAALLLMGCGGGGSTQPNPMPAINSLLPLAVQMGGSGFPLLVNGTGFTESSTVLWNGSNRATSFNNSTQLSASIMLADRSVTTTAVITVVNPSPGGGTSNGFNFYVIPPPTPGLGVIQMISVATDGASGNGNSYTNASVSGDGRFVAFQSDSSNLVPGAASGYADIFLRDTCIGVPTGCVPNTSRVSLAPDGSLANGNSRNPSISADGRFVAFDSSASNLVAGDTNGQSDVFIYDTCIGAAGCVPLMSRVVADDGSEPNNDTRFAAISADGRYVAFGSGATNLIPGGTTGGVGNVFVRDTCSGVTSGCVPGTTLASASSSGTQGNTTSGLPAISGVGRFIVFLSYATNLVSNDTNGQPDFFVRDTCFGVPTGCTPITTRVDVATDGTQANDRADVSPTISGDGRYVAFTSFATNLVSGDTNGVSDIFARDTCAAAVGCAPSTYRVSVTFNGLQANQGSGDPSISADGRFIAFDSLATNLIATGTYAPVSIFVRDTCLGAPAGCLPNTSLMSAATDGSQGNSYSQYPAISASGQYVVFLSDDTNLIAGGSNGNTQVWIAKVF